MLSNTIDHGKFARERISDGMIDAFDRDGAIIVRDVIDARWIEHMRAAVDAELENPRATASENAVPGEGRFYGDTFVWLHNDAFKTFLFESPLAELSARIMRAEKVNFFYDQLLVKEPGTSARTPWHQDLPYWPVAGWQVASIWVPFDLATPETGVVNYIKGSHLWGKLYEPRPFGPKKRKYEGHLDEVPDIDAAPQNYEYVTGVLKPGDVFIHHSRTIHGAPGNTSGRLRRRALATRWIGEDATWEDRPSNFMRLPKYEDLLRRNPMRNGEALDSELFPVILPRRGS